MNGQRLDKYLFFVRLTRTRALAQQIVAQGHVRINGQSVVRGHAAVAPGQVITLPLHDQIRVIRVTGLPSRRGPAVEAQAHYCDLSPNQPIDVGGE